MNIFVIIITAKSFKNQVSIKYLFNIPARDHSNSIKDDHNFQHIQLLPTSKSFKSAKSQFIAFIASCHTLQQFTISFNALIPCFNVQVHSPALFVFIFNSFNTNFNWFAHLDFMNFYAIIDSTCTKLTKWEKQR